MRILFSPKSIVGAPATHLINRAMIHSTWAPMTHSLRNPKTRPSGKFHAVVYADVDLIIASEYQLNLVRVLESIALKKMMVDGGASQPR